MYFADIFVNRYSRMNTDLLSLPSCLFITGASGGYGSALAKTFAIHLQPGSLLVLSGRNTENLAKVSDEVKLLTSNNVQVESITCDLEKISDIDHLLSEFQPHFESSSVTNVILIHNAGSIGDVALKMDQYDNALIQQTITTNVSNILYFTIQFLTRCSRKQLNNCCIVNISSLLALQSAPSCGLYCTTKAARDMMFSVLAKERKDLRILSWAPGPMPTKMLQQMCDSHDGDIASMFKDFFKKKSYVECKDSAEKLLMVLKKNGFESGSHIDFYDV